MESTYVPYLTVLYRRTLPTSRASPPYVSYHRELIHSTITDYTSRVRLRTLRTQTHRWKNISLDLSKNISVSRVSYLTHPFFLPLLHLPLLSSSSAKKEFGRLCLLDTQRTHHTYIPISLNPSNTNTPRAHTPTRDCLLPLCRRKKGKRKKKKEKFDKSLPKTQWVNHS